MLRRINLGCSTWVLFGVLFMRVSGALGESALPDAPDAAVSNPGVIAQDPTQKSAAVVPAAPGQERVLSVGMRNPNFPGSTSIPHAINRDTAKFRPVDLDVTCAARVARRLSNQLGVTRWV